MRKLHSIYLTRETGGQRELPERIAANLASFRHCYPDSQHQLYELPQGRQFILDKFGPEVLHAFDELVPLAYKADLLRYCLLFEFGGVYADLGVHFFYPVEPSNPSKRLVIFRDAVSQAPWIVSNALIVAEPGLKLFETCIHKIVEHVRDGYYGYNSLCPTGPNLFGQEIARNVPLGEMDCGEAIRINRSQTHSFAYLDIAGDVVCVNVKRGSGFASLGGKAHEEYNSYYVQKGIYASRKVDALNWSHEEMSTRGWIKNEHEQRIHSGMRSNGPYVTLRSGRFKATLVVEDTEAIDLSAYSADVCRAYGTAIIPSRFFVEGDASEGKKSIAVEFELEESSENVEVRLYVAHPGFVKVESLKLEEVAFLSGPVIPSADDETSALEATANLQVSPAGAGLDATPAASLDER